MAKIKIIAGDVPKQSCSVTFGVFQLLGHGESWGGTSHNLHDFSEAMVASEENVKKLGGAAGWGIAGGVLLGPVGLLAGLLAGGRKKEVTFVAKLPGNKKILAVTDHKTWQKILAAQF